LSQSGKTYRAESYAAEPTPPNSINEKTIVDAPAVGEAIRRAVKRAGTSSKDVAIAIGGDAAITKIIQMPRRFTARELEGQVEIQADQYIPFPMEEVSFRFPGIGTVVNRSGDARYPAGRNPNRECRSAQGRS
jgi:type IV pilus assembly protein PilM